MLSFLLAGQAFAQKNWDIYTFGSICSFRVPPSMELRDLDSSSGMILKKLTDEHAIRFGIDLPTKEIRFQPKGINSSSGEDAARALAVYARIMIADLEGDCPSQGEVANATAKDIKEVDVFYKRETLQGLRLLNPDGKLIWLPLIKARIGGKYALVSRYKRSSPKGGLVYVREYKFFLTTHLLRITVSYRENESHLWKQDLDKFIGTLSFN